MGNHDAGHGIVQTAAALIAVREQTNQTAFEILEISCRPWVHIGDPEYDEEDRQGQPFGELLRETFCPDFSPPSPRDEPDYDHECVVGDLWFEQVIKPFLKWQSELRTSESHPDQSDEAISLLKSSDGK